jgi:formate C-acetyltransferase
VQGCIAQGKDLSQSGAIYNNYGFHGAGIATAADSLAAIKEVIFDTAEVTKGQLLAALEADFEGYGALRNRLLKCPKMGSGNQDVDGLAYRLMETFAQCLKGHTNNMGGIFRPGTGSAHEYHFSAIQVGATADGRKAYAPYGCSFSPSLEAKPTGPLSCIRSFTGFDLTKVINGGPLTLELHHNVFRNEEGIQKTAQLVKAFIHLGGHQLQLNCINRDTLMDALAHPEEHKNLIVRVWGWSGYFCELDPHFQQHILKRTEFTI